MAASMNIGSQVAQDARLKEGFVRLGIEALRADHAFEGSPLKMLTYLVQQRARVKSIPQGTMLQTVAGGGAGVIILVEGQAEKTNQMGQTAQMLGPRSVVGTETLFGQRPQYNCAATTAVVALHITKDDIDGALQQFPSNSQLATYLSRSRNAAHDQGNGPRKGMNRRDFIKSVPLFHSMPPRMIEDLQVRLKTDFFPADTWIVTEGEVGDSMYFIVDGSCELSSMKTGQVLATLHTGEFFGEMAAIFNEVRTSSARTTQPTSVFRLSAIDLKVQCPRPFGPLPSAPGPSLLRI
jgi:CRP-like cAMP-binding protein